MGQAIRFELRISDLNQALSLSETWASHVVSLLDPDHVAPVPCTQNADHLCRQFFHDISPEDLNDDIWQTLAIKPIVATRPQIERILAFTQQLKRGDRLLIHCHAGVSRSTAVACGVLCQHGLTAQYALERVLELRPMASPNGHILRLMDEVLALNGGLQRWQRRIKSRYS